MIQLSLRMKKDESCPDDLLESITNCLEQTLTYSHNHHHQLNKMAQMEKLRVLSDVIQTNLMAEVPDYRLYCWVTEVGSNSYFVWIVYSQLRAALSGRLYFRVQVTNKVSSLKENCIEVVGPRLRSLQESQIRGLDLPRVLMDQLLDYFHTVNTYLGFTRSHLKIFPANNNDKGLVVTCVKSCHILSTVKYTYQ